MKAMVVISKRAAKALKKAPKHVAIKLAHWVELVEAEGLAEARKVPGYHDEPLKGDREGQRSIRLSKKWRAIYVVTETEFELVSIEEVTPHDY